MAVWMKRDREEDRVEHDAKRRRDDTKRKRHNHGSEIFLVDDCKEEGEILNDDYPIERDYRYNSSDRAHVSERKSRSPSFVQDDRGYYKEERVKSSHSREKRREESDLRRVNRHESKEHKHGSRNKERERSSSYNRHERRDDRHGSRDHPREKEHRKRDKGRQEEVGLVGKWNSEAGHDNHGSRDKERERSSSYSRHVSRDDRHGSRGYLREKEHRERDKGRQEDVELNDNGDSRHSTNSEAGHDKEFEESEEKLTRDEIEDEEEVLKRIKEESRKRTEAILAKYIMQQQQKLGEPRPENSEIEKEVLPVVEPKEVKEKAEEIFCDDMFGDSPLVVAKTGKRESPDVVRNILHDNCDDEDGYYLFRSVDAVLDGRYEVTAALGKGVFSSVVRAKDLKAGKGEPEQVAIKIIRDNSVIHKAGLQEIEILKKLAGKDPIDRHHCVRFISSFNYGNHLCLVLESLHMNLREVLNKIGLGQGLKLTAVSKYAKQIFIALLHLQKRGVLHCDIKPDNILVNEAKNVLKLCDFGNAMLVGENEVTPYLASRFYRAPEVIIGLPYSFPMDVWSVGCCLYELYSGKPLFPGRNNNEMLHLQMKLQGPFSKKMLRKGAFTKQNFDGDLNFLAKSSLDMGRESVSTKLGAFHKEDQKMAADFGNLLEKLLALDPMTRMTASQALKHPFITGK